MPLFVAALVGALVSAASTLVGRVLISLGIGYVTYNGVSFMLDSLRNLFVAQSSSMGQWLPYLGVLKLDVCLGILLAAVTARYTLQGLTSGTIKRMVIK